MPRRRNIALDLDDAIERYLAGESPGSIGRQYGVTSNAIRYRLIVAGVDVRTGGESQRTRWRREDALERAARIAALHRDSRGRPKSQEMLERRAGTNQRLGRTGRVGAGEAEMTQWLRERGLNPIPQYAIDRYNIDVAVLPVAVEILTGGWSRLVKPGNLRRLEALSHRGVPAVYVVVTDARSLTPAAADDVVAFRERVQRDPTTPAEYRVIRGAGQLVAAGRGDLHQSTLVWPTRGANQFGG